MTGRRWDVLAWNGAATEVLTDFGCIAEEDRNILLFMMTDPSARVRFGPSWDEEARRMVAQFRTTYDLWAGDPAFSALIARTRRDSPEFVLWWDAHDVRDVAVGQKLLHYPGKEPRRFDYATFQVNDDPALKLAIYTPA